MECCVCLETISYYSYRMKCKHDLCEKCAYQIFDANSKNFQILEKHRQACYLACPLCRTDSILKIGERYVYYFDNIINLSSITETMEYIDHLYKSKEDNIPYIMIMYPDGETFILDPKTKYIYSAYNEKYRIGEMKSKRVGDTGLQTWMTFDYKWFIYLRDFMTCSNSRLRV
jgi:hypothetical protein